MRARHWRAPLLWPPWRWLVAVATAVIVALATGIPTGVVPSALYGRMTPVAWWDYPIWVVSALLVGGISATYLGRGQPTGGRTAAGRTLGGWVLAVFAVGCPICNKIVITLVGVSGALDYWAPAQPVIGLVSLGLLLATLVLRLTRSETFCVREAGPG